MTKNHPHVFKNVEDLSDELLRQHKNEISKFSILEADLFLGVLEARTGIRFLLDETGLSDRKRAGQIYEMQDDIKHAILSRLSKLTEHPEAAQLDAGAPVN